RRRMLALETAEPEWWERGAWLEQVEHGRALSIPDWFDTDADFMRMRYLRAVADLEAAGLLVRFCRWGRKLSHIELMAEGMKAAAELGAWPKPMPIPGFATQSLPATNSKLSHRIRGRRNAIAASAGSPTMAPNLAD